MTVGQERHRMLALAAPVIPASRDFARIPYIRPGQYARAV